jgi:hypothetical protein
VVTLPIALLPGPVDISCSCDRGNALDLPGAGEGGRWLDAGPGGFAPGSAREALLASLVAASRAAPLVLVRPAKLPPVTPLPPCRELRAGMGSALSLPGPIRITIRLAHAGLAGNE